MNRKRFLLFACCGSILVLLLAGFIGALLKLVNIQALLIATLLIIGFSIQAGLPWWKNFLKKRARILYSKSKSEFTPTSRKDAARKSLDSIEKLIELIQDKVTAEALKQKQELVQNELNRGDLIVVVFGTGSSGKTSLIRALLKKIIGDVGAAMGSTQKSKSYRLKLKGLNRAIQITDTPGILEAGSAGREREKKAIIRASKADLMIVVIDNDLRRTELEVLKYLSNIGKRVLIVINKIDLRGLEEERRIITLIQNKCSNFISPKDIVTTAASPQSIPKPGGNPIQPLPEINNLIKRMAHVLHEEGEELIADNILLQCRSLNIEGRQLLNKQRLLNAKKCIDRYCWISSGVVTVTALPGVDLLGAAAVNAQMVIEIAKAYEVKLTSSRAQELALSVGKTLAALGIVKGGVSIITSALTLNLPTIVISRVIQGVTAAWLTRVAGASFITYFEQDQNWGDGGIQEVVQLHYKLNKREKSLRKFIDKALKTVIDPLTNSQLKKLPPNQKLQREAGASDLENPIQ